MGANRIGVCLSAGGFRSALFGMGVFRYLAEAGLLRRVTAISAISGGSILGAWLAERWAGSVACGAAFPSLTAEPFCTALAGDNLRNRWLREWLSHLAAPRPRGRGPALARALQGGLVPAVALRDIPPDVQLVLSATDLGSGRPFHFSRDFVGGRCTGYARPPASLALSTAVAAATAAPEYFSPVQLHTRALGLTGERPLSLVDGAVYDNLATEWFDDWDTHERPEEARRPDFLVVVDGAGPLSFRNRRYGSLAALVRAPRISTAHMRSERVSKVRGRFERGERSGVLVCLRDLPRGLPFPLDQPTVRAGLAGLRTDLDRFLPVESTLLTYAGYWGCHEQLRSRHPEAATREPAWRIPTDGFDLPRVAEALARGQHHLARDRLW